MMTSLKLSAAVFLLIFINGVVGNIYMYNCPRSDDTKTYYIHYNPIEVKPKATDSKEDPLISKYNFQYNMTYMENGQKKIQSIKEFLIDNSFLRIAPDKLKVDVDYEIGVTHEAKSGNDGPKQILPTKTQMCYLKMRDPFPIAIISGGSYRTMPSTEITVDAKQSLNMHKDTPDTEGLTYAWKCKQKTKNDFCNKDPVSAQSTLVIPAKFARDGEEFSVQVKVSEKGKAYGTEAKQTISIVADAPQLEIKCLQNCFPPHRKSDFKQKTLLEVSCLENCRDIDENDYYWTLKSENFDYSKTTGRTGSKFAMNENALQPGIYDVEVKLKSRRATSVLTLDYVTAPKYRSCKFKPQNGKAFKTKFAPSCVLMEKWDMNDFYELFIRDAVVPQNQRRLTSGVWSRWNLDTLPPNKGKKFIIKFYRDRATWSEYVMEVGDILASENHTLSEDMDFLKKNFTRMISSNDPSERQEAKDRLMETLDKLTDNVTENNMAELIKELKYVIPENILKLPIPSLEDVAIALLAVVKIENIQSRKKTDPALDKIVTTACKKIGERAFELIKKHMTDPGIKSLVSTINQALNQCLEKGANPNFNILDPEERLDFTTPEATLDEIEPTEHYEEYVDHDKLYYKRIEDLKETNFNMINGTMMAAKMKALTLTVGEGPSETLGEICKTIIIKDTGRKLLKIPLQLDGIRVVPSEDFTNDTHAYDILFSTWKTDIMWWNPDVTRVVTDIISLQVWHSMCTKRVTDFKKPVDIFLRTKNGTFLEDVKEYSFVVPADYAKMSDDEINYQIQVHRIGLPKGQKLSVKFHNLSPEDELHAVVTIDKFPSVGDFIKSVSIEENSNLLTLVNEYGYSTFIYLAIMPKKASVVKRKRITYQISSILTICLKWRTLNSKWEPACALKEVNYTDNGTILHCQCWNLSVLAGYMQNIKLTQQTIIKPDLELEMTCCFVIFSTIILTLIVYFILLIFAVVKRKEPLYFLADNNAQHKFAYVVTVKTGWRWTAGTSSNIMIQVTGSKTKSEPHVLNYPDPKMRLLQRFGNEKYLLTTGSHLGNLEKIELWFDAIGQNPFWYCRDITVYDMQLHKEWSFKVEGQLSLNEGRSFIVVEPEKAMDVSREVSAMKSRSTIKQSSFYKLPSNMHFEKHNYTFMHSTHNWYFWHLEEHFSYFKKLTIVLSTILTVYCIASLFVPLPKMQMNDCVDPYYGHRFGIYEFLYAIASSFPVFVIHLWLGWVFRYSRLQYSAEKQDSLWPFFCTALCWAIVICLIVGSLTYLLIFGFWIQHYTSLIWLGISWIGMLMGIFVYESIFACLQTIFCRIDRKSIEERFVTIWKTTDIQRKYLYSRFGEPILRPYFEHLYVPLKRRMIKEKKRLMTLRYSVIGEFEDLFMFGIYIIVLYVVILADKDSGVVRGHKNMVAMIQGDHIRALDFRDVQSTADLYIYINYTLIPTIQPIYWYGNYVISAPGMMADVRTKYLGVVRFRQHRIHRWSHYCETVDVMKFLNVTCWPEFSMRYAESGRYGYRWGEFTSHMIYDRMRTMWQYTFETTQPFVGAVAVYSGGGYIAFLGRTLYNSYANFKKIKEKWWIDDDSNVIFIEFMAFNMDYNIFDAVTLTFEKSSTDYFQANIMVYTVRMLMDEKRYATVSFYLFAIWVGLLLFRSAKGAVKNIRGFVTNLWMLIDTFIIVMSVLCIVLFGLRMVAIEDYLDTLEEVRNNEFVSYFHLFYIEDFLTVVAALLVCVATIRLWKFLRFSTMFLIMERTLMITLKTFLCFLLTFSVVLVATSLTLLLIVGHEFYRMHTTVKTIRLLATFALKAVEFKAAEILEFKTAILYVVIYSVYTKITMMMLTMFVVWAYSEAQREFSGKTDIYTVKDYMIERTLYLLKLCKYRFCRGGQTNIQAKVEPKTDKFIYTNSFLVRTRRMILMAYLTLCLFRKKIKKHEGFSEYDQKLIFLICRRRLIKTHDHDDVEVFFKGRVAGKRIEFVDEKHLDLMSNIVNVLLQDEEVVFDQKERNVPLDECIKVTQKGQATLRSSILNLNLLYHKIKAAEAEVDKLEVKKH